LHKCFIEALQPPYSQTDVVRSAFLSVIVIGIFQLLVYKLFQHYPETLFCFLKSH
jgi:hypothetical protein